MNDSSMPQDQWEKEEMDMLIQKYLEVCEEQIMASAYSKPSSRTSVRYCILHQLEERRIEGNAEPLRER